MLVSRITTFHVRRFINMVFAYSGHRFTLSYWTVLICAIRTHHFHNSSFLYFRLLKSTNVRYLNQEPLNTQARCDSGTDRQRQSSLVLYIFFSFFAKEHMWVLRQGDVYVRKTDICLIRDERTTDADTHFAFWKDNYLAGGCSSLMSTNRLLLYKQLLVVCSRLQGLNAG